MIGLNSTVNLIALSAALFLGLYLVTRSHRQPAWLAAATLWSLVGYFLNRLVNLNFTDYRVVTLLGGWSAILVAPLWYHLSTAFYPAARARRWLLPLGYLIAVAFLILMTQTDLLFRGPTAMPATTGASAGAGPLYPTLGAFLLGYGLLALWNLWRARVTVPRLLQPQLTIIFWATVVAFVGAAYLVIIDLFHLAALLVIGDLLLGVAVVVLGYGLARYNTLLEGRSTGRDLGYMAAVIALTVSIYLAVIGVFFEAYAIPLAAVVPVIILVIISHTLYDGYRSRLDYIFYRRSSADLRASLRALAGEAGAIDLNLALREALLATCVDLGADRGLLGLRRDGTLHIVASLRAGAPGRVLAEFTIPDDAVALTTPDSMLGDMAAIAPLLWGDEKLGFLAVGPRPGGYTRGVLSALADVADRLAGAVHASQASEAATVALTTQIEALQAREQEMQAQVQQLTTSTLRADETDMTRQVEDALRRLYDFPYLGEHSLANLAVVTAAATSRAGGAPTVIDRGQALRDVLLRNLERLKPSGSEPKGDATATRREWHAYLVLRESYVDNIPTRDTMNRLLISEGTYNRTRRQALRGLATALADEEAARKQTT